ncbi:MAG: MoxR family ATPase [Burkholderiales bacterium]|jgi:MoxR-like ATPase|nr:MoxR family ATPase [Burkholderiales bacterium]
MALASFKTPDRIAAILKQLASVVIGKPVPIKLALTCLLARGHLLIEDLPGVGKSTLAQALAVTLGLPFSRVQFTSDLLPADVLGVSIYDNTKREFFFHPGPVFSSVLLADEINRAPPKTQSALLEAMEERQVSIDGKTYPLPSPFFVIATQNPVEQQGVYPLPESQIDRFLMALELGFPDGKAERELLMGGDARAKLAQLPTLADQGTLLGWQEDVGHIHVASAILDYVQALLAATRGVSQANGDHGALALRGLSPRAGLMLLLAARAHAFLSGRDFVIPEDVQTVFPSVAGHRLTGSAHSGQSEALHLLRQVRVG